MVDLPAPVVACVAVWERLEMRACADRQVTLRPADRLAEEVRG